MNVQLKEDWIISDTVPSKDEELTVTYPGFWGDRAIGTAKVLEVHVTDMFVEDKKVGEFTTLDLQFDKVGEWTTHQWKKA